MLTVVVRAIFAKHKKAKMNKLFPTVMLVCMAISVKAQEYEWVKTYPSSSEGAALDIDPQNSVYSTGHFGSNIQVDESTTLTSAGLKDIYLTKHNAQGDLLWGLSIGGGQDDFSADLAATDDGGVVLVGEFQGTANFNPLGVENNMTSAGAPDAFIAKYSSEGLLVWVRKIGGANIDRATGVSLTQNGELRVVGSYAGLIDFDPGEGNFEAGTNLGGGFVLALNENGEFIWVHTFYNTSFQALGSYHTAVSTDTNGNTYVGGNFKGTIDFLPNEDGGELTSTGLTDCMMARIDADGNLLYAKSWGSVSGDFLYGLDTDAQGNAYLVGSFAGVIDMDPGEESYELVGEDFTVDFFVLRLNVDGNFGWAFKIGDSGMDEAYDIAVEGTHVYVTGVFAGANVDFDPGEGEILLSAVLTSPFDPFLLTADTEGNVSAAISFGGEDNDIGNALAVDPSGAIYITGRYHGTADFDPSEAIAELTAMNSHDTYLVKFDIEAAPLNVPDLEGNQFGLIAYPIPASNNLSLSFNADTPQPYAIYSLDGLQVQNGMCSNRAELFIGDLVNGMYILKVASQAQRIVVLK